MDAVGRGIDGRGSNRFALRIPLFTAGGRWIGKASARLFSSCRRFCCCSYHRDLEDSGYLARAALIAIAHMSRFGLQGKSSSPALRLRSPVPAIYGDGTIESKRDRIATVLIAPFMTCSARLPCTR